jgi:hypothetical protein
VTPQPEYEVAKSAQSALFAGSGGLTVPSLAFHWYLPRLLVEVGAFPPAAVALRSRHLQPEHGRVLQSGRRGRQLSGRLPAVLAMVSGL